MKRTGHRLRTALQPYRQYVAQLKRTGVFLGLGIALISSIHFAYDPSRTARVRHQQQEVERLHALNAELSESIERKMAQLAAMRNDPNYVVHLARRELGMLKPGEIAYEFQLGSIGEPTK
ncbi:MAG: hypothetical protein CMH54_15605 [Myxococcales bacterium]|mgnify:CR=1 FL=1|nr:hypothetical protein [Myxococcales bacterium]